MDARESKLPQWARAELARLRTQVKAGNEPLLAEVAKSRPRIELLKRQVDAMTELLTAAAKGGSKTAAEIVDVLESYGLTVTER